MLLSNTKNNTNEKTTMFSDFLGFLDPLLFMCHIIPRPFQLFNGRRPGELDQHGCWVRGYSAEKKPGRS